MEVILTTDTISAGRIKINNNFESLPDLIQSYVDNLDWQQSVLSRVQITAPTASEGDRYIVGEVVDTEDPWYGHDYEVATKTESGWSFITPNIGYCVTVEDENLEYVWAATNEWVSRAYATWHNHLGGLDGGDGEAEEFYHLSQDTYLGLASVTKIDPAVVDSDARLSDTRDPNAHTHSESDITDLQSYALDGHNHDLAYSAIGHTHSYAASDHDSSHILGGADVIDGDKLEISWNPTNSTPDSVPDYSDNLDHLTSHLKGIDAAIGGKSDTGHTHDYAASSHSHSESDITDLGSYALDNHDATHITSGSDEIDGDKLDIDWNPSNYTPATVEDYADSVDNLTAHLKGIDSAIGSVSSGITAGKSIALSIVFGG